MLIITCIGKRIILAHFLMINKLVTVIFHSVRLLRLLCEYSAAGRLPVASLSVQPAGNPSQPLLRSGHLLGLEVPELFDHSSNGQHSTSQLLLLLCLILKKQKKFLYSSKRIILRAYIASPLSPVSTYCQN